jgi:sugar phosphate isomerase/epimerase
MQNVAPEIERSHCPPRHLWRAVAAGLPVSSLGADGGLVQLDALAQERWFEGLAEAAAIARATGATTVMISTGMQGRATSAQAAVLLARAGRLLSDKGLRLAYEFNAYHPEIRSLDAALALVGEVGLQNVGLTLDAYHLHLSGSEAALARLRVEDIFCVQISDVPPAALRTPPADRLVPGEGSVDWIGLFAALHRVGYVGPVAFEAPNPTLWQEDPQGLAVRGKAAILDLWEAGTAMSCMPPC